MINRSESQLLLDRIVFSNRNQSYGAFVLRKEYNSRLKTGMVMAIFFFTSILFIPQLIKIFHAEKVIDGLIVCEIGKVIELEQIEIYKPKIITPPSAEKIETAKMETVKNLVPIIQSDKEVLGEDLPASQKDLLNSNSGYEDSKGEKVIAILTPELGGGQREVEIKEFEIWASEDAKFKEGEFIKFIQKKLNYPLRAIDLGISGTVYVQFIIEKDGTVTDIKVTKGIGSGCDEEAIRVIKLTSGMWNSGKNSGTPVRLRKVLPIKFKLSD